MTLVVDANVVVKWLLSDPERESATKHATNLMRSVVEGRETILQPPHWLAEVAAVLARLSPGTAEEDALMLRGLEIPIDDGPAVLSRACKLAIDSGQHVLDTLYHAVALETPHAIFVTADDRYLRASRRYGSIHGLTEWVQENVG